MLAWIQARCVALVVAVASMGGAVSAARAHQLPLSLGMWGGFDSRDVALCQQVIGLAAARCGSQAWAARTACFDTEFDGSSCDQQATDSAVQQAHITALALVDRVCTGSTLPSGFALGLDVDADVDSFCGQLDAAAVSAVYGPVLRGGSMRPANTTVRRCVGGTAAAATRLLQFAFTARRRTLDRIACRHFLPMEKFRLVTNSTQRIQAAVVRFAQQVAASCADADFQRVYQRSAPVVLTGIAQRADCLAGASYVQSEIVCPPAVCGNGMQEPGERCDDGNTADGDGCSSRCIKESAAATALPPPGTPQ